MSHIAGYGVVKTTLPHWRYSATTPITTITLNAAGETAQFIGDIYLENPTGGSKTISAAGGGSILWRSDTTTFANAGSTFDIGIQDVSTASSPAQGDGTFDVKASFTGGGGGVSTAAINTSVMTTGTKTIAHGDQVAIAFAMTARAGADSIIVGAAGTGTEVNASAIGSVVVDNTGGTYAPISGYPLAIIKFDDGTIGYISSTSFIASSGTTAINSTTGTADEYGNLIVVPWTFHAAGIHDILNFVDNAADCELVLYSDPLGTPVAERVITIDATQLGITATARPVTKLFSTPFLMKANIPYAVTVRPTTANNVTLYYEDGVTDSVRIHPPNSYAYGVRRLDNTGAFSDTNGGTAKTRVYRCSVFGYFIEQGVNSTTYQIGM